MAEGIDAIVHLGGYSIEGPWGWLSSACQHWTGTLQHVRGSAYHHGSQNELCSPAAITSSVIIATPAEQSIQMYHRGRTSRYAVSKAVRRSDWTPLCR